jgi:hypothetical protein
MSNLPKDPKEPKRISPTRIALWALVGGFGLYYLISGLIGVLHR